MKNNYNNKIINKKILFIFLVVIVCLILFPIQFINNDILKSISIATPASNSSNRPARYTETELSRTTYVDASGREYYIEYKQNLPGETLLSYEDVISHKASGKNGSNQYQENKDLYIAEMKKIPNLNYEKRYRNQFNWQNDISDEILSIADTDSTITKTESTRLARIWNALGNGKYVEIYDQEKILMNNSNFFEVGEVFASTTSIALYKRNATVLTVGDGINSGEAYVMASNRNPSVNLDVDKNQQALWIANGQAQSIDKIPNDYLGINPEANIVGNNIAAEAEAIRDYTDAVEDFKETHKIDNLKTELYDNMWEIYDTTNGMNYYESGLAGIVGYDKIKKEYLVGPFSIDYVREVYIPKSGGQSENQSEDGLILYNSIIDASIYGINSNGEEVKLTDWAFIYPDVEYDLDKGKAVRSAETSAIKNGDNVLNMYPYPNEKFYIRFNDSTIKAITKFEYTMSSLNAEAEVYLYEGQYYNVSWKGAVQNGQSYLQMTPSWKEIKEKNLTGITAANIYQVKSAEVLVKEKKYTLLVGKYHELPLDSSNEKYRGYCIPITMELAGTVWYDGTEEEQITNQNKVFGIRDKDQNGEYIEDGMKDVNVYLYEKNKQEPLKTTKTDENGNYIFEYVKVGPEYYIEFEYDGMKYKATTYLNGDQTNNKYIDPTEFLNYLDYSHTKEDDEERETFNKRFTEIKNGTINDNIREIGEAVSDVGKIEEISYTTYDFPNELNKDIIGGTADINRLDFRARTKTTQLIYPLQNRYIITNKDLSIVDNNQELLSAAGVKNMFALGKLNLVKNKNYIVKIGNKSSSNQTEETNFYSMIDTQLHHINLGLIERTPIDFAVKNDVVKTTLTFVDDAPENNILDFGKRSCDSSNFDIGSRSNIEGQKYFDETYEQTIEYNKYIDKHDFYTNEKRLENDNAQLYITYKMTIRNQAEITSGYITELINYYEDDLYYPVDSNEMWKYYDKNINYVEEFQENGGKGYGNMIIPQVSSLTSWAVKNNAEGEKTELGQINWSSSSKFSGNDKEAPDGLRIMYTNSLANELLAPEETIDIYVLYKVESKENTAIPNGYGTYISNDNAGNGKRNILEINSYKALNPDNSPGGRVDKDSAPGNSGILNHITYEDDTDAAPYLRVIVEGKTEGNSITGHVWEDNKTEKLVNNQMQGNGQIDYNSSKESIEDYINDVMVELIRLEYNQETGEYEEVEFTEKYKETYPEKYGEIYPDTEETLSKDTAKVITWTGLNNKNEDTIRPLTAGQYRFDNLVSGGKYKVRFVYGSNEQLRTEILNNNNIVYNGHDFRSTIYAKGDINLNNIEPSTEISYVVDAFELSNKSSNSSIINVLKEINNSLKLTNTKIKTNIYAFGDKNYRECANFDQIISSQVSRIQYSALETISTSGNKLLQSAETNKIMIIYNDGVDFRKQDVQEKIKELTKNGILVIGIGYGVDSLDIYRIGENETILVETLEANGENNEYIQGNIVDNILDIITESYYMINNFSHAEDYIQNTAYTTMNGNTKNVTGRLEVMKYSQEMDPLCADSLNLEYIKTITPNLSENSEWSKVIKQLADKTQMTADSYEVSFDGEYYEEKILNLGLEEIPRRILEVTNQVDNIVINLSNGDKLIDLRDGKTQNVQEIKDEMFSIYMDDEIMQGATIQVTYRINVSNIGEVDNLYSYVRYATEEEKKNWYKLLTGEDIIEGTNVDQILNETETIKITKLYSYYDDLLFRGEDNNRWEIINKTVEIDENLNARRDSYGNLIYRNEDDESLLKNMRDEMVVWKQVNNTVDNPNILERNKNNISKYFIVETTSLEGIELYPNISKEVIDNLNEYSITKPISKPISTLCTYLVLSKVISAEDMNTDGALNYKNYVEVISTYSNIGRRGFNNINGFNIKNNCAEGNFQGNENLIESILLKEMDTDKAEIVNILPPFGNKKIMIGMIILFLVVLSIGIIFVKRKLVK